MGQIKKLLPDEMPREKLLELGAKSLSNSELLAILIGSGTKDLNAVELCRHILSDSQNDLDVLARKTVKDLMQFKGIGEAKAITIVSALEIARRRKTNLISQVNNIIRSSKEAYDLLHDIFMDLPHEEFWILCLNQRNEVIKRCEISKGGLNFTVVDPKIIYRLALEQRACSIILAHNHPSGNTLPSEADEKLTKRLVDSGKMLDIKVLDHIIYTNNGYYSFGDECKL